MGAAFTWLNRNPPRAGLGHSQDRQYGHEPVVRPPDATGGPRMPPIPKPPPSRAKGHLWSTSA